MHFAAFKNQPAVRIKNRTGVCGNKSREGFTHDAVRVGTQQLRTAGIYRQDEAGPIKSEMTDRDEIKIVRIPALDCPGLRVTGFGGQTFAVLRR